MMKKHGQGTLHQRCAHLLRQLYPLSFNPDRIRDQRHAARHCACTRRQGKGTRGSRADRTVMSDEEVLAKRRMRRVSPSPRPSKMLRLAGSLLRRTILPGAFCLFASFRPLRFGGSAGTWTTTPGIEISESHTRTTHASDALDPGILAEQMGRWKVVGSTPARHDWLM